LILRADAALYAAKDAGRNRIILAPASPAMFSAATGSAATGSAATDSAATDSAVSSPVGDARSSAPR
jgi:hypothetical protein